MSIEWRWLYDEAEERKLQETEQTNEKIEIKVLKNLAKRCGVKW